MKIFHGGCLECMSQALYGIKRCDLCMYKEWDRNLENLSIYPIEEEQTENIEPGDTQEYKGEIGDVLVTSSIEDLDNLSISGEENDNRTGTSTSLDGCNCTDSISCSGGVEKRHNKVDGVFRVTEVESDGGKNNFYTFPSFVTNIDSLARYLDLNGAEFNVLKSLTAKLGARHSGTDEKREVKKGLHYSVERMLWKGYNADEILEQVSKQLGEIRCTIKSY